MMNFKLLYSKILNRKAIYWFAPFFFVISVLVRFFTIEFTSNEVLNQATLNFLQTFLPVAFLSLGAGLVLSTGGVDLSSAGVMTFSGVIFAILSQEIRFTIITLVIPFIATTIIGIFLGRLVYRRMSPMITSWCIGVILIAISKFLASYNASTNKTSSIQNVALGHNINIDWTIHNSVIIWAFTALIILLLLLKMLNLPAKAKAVGANIDSARFIGLNVKMTLILVYTFAALFSTCGGMLSALVNNSATTVEHQGFELIGIAISVLGGTMMSGGYYNQWSILFAAGFWAITNNYLITMNIPFLPEEHHNRAAAIIFSLFLLGILYLFRNKISQQTQQILTEKKTGDE